MKYLIAIAVVLAINGAQASPFERLINGSLVEHFPSFALINATGAAQPGGGHIISPLHILTGASVIRGYSQWTIGIGYNTISSHYVYTSFQGIAHPDYVPETGASDIGIIFNPAPLVFGINIQSILIPSVSLNLPFENEQGSVYGYGSSDASSTTPSFNLQMIHPRVFSTTRCTEYFPTHDSGKSFCALDELAANICHGDAGGGFILAYRREEYLVGIATNINSCQTMLPSPYTRVHAFRQWISDLTNV